MHFANNCSTCFADICCRLKLCFCLLPWINKMLIFDYFSFTAYFGSLLFLFHSRWELVKVCFCVCVWVLGSVCLCECDFSLKVELKETTICYAAVLELFFKSCSSRTIFCILSTTFTPSLVVALFFFVVVVISILQKAVPVLIFVVVVYFCCL